MANENTPTTSAQESPKPADSPSNPGQPNEAKPDQKDSPAETKEERARS